MNHHTFGQRVLRGLFLVLLVAAPLSGCDIGTIVTIGAAVLIAYEPLRLRSAGYIVGGVAGMEVFYGLDYGTWSLGVAIAAISVELLQRWVGFTPWAMQRRWYVGDAVRWLVVAVVSAVIIRIVTWGSLWMFYGLSDAMHRISGMFLMDDMIVIGVLMIGMVVLWRRIDEPFRRPIQFGI